MHKPFTIRPQMIGTDITIHARSLDGAVDAFVNLLGLAIVSKSIRKDEADNDYAEFVIGTGRKFFAFAAIDF